MNLGGQVKPYTAATKVAADKKLSIGNFSRAF
jgi:hypothetical protein